jgi:2-hydroxycyclohexanecarboxyl-CoA dehydrogenase
VNPNGRTALVTGGARGMGRGIAETLAADGHAVVIIDLSASDARSTAAALRASGAQALAVEGDVTSTASVAAAVDAAHERFGAVDVLVNCAGWDELMPFVATDEAFWDRVIEINLKGPLRVIHRVLPGMVERGWGRIINIASDAGRVGSSHESVYSGAKGGIIAFTKTIARESACHGVTANTVCPGPTDTPGLRTAMSDGGDAVIASMARSVPMRRLGTPEDVAAAVSFFASEGAGYVTGQTLSVSGGLTMA